MTRMVRIIRAMFCPRILWVLHRIDVSVYESTQVGVKPPTTHAGPNGPQVDALSFAISSGTSLPTVFSVHFGVDTSLKFTSTAGAVCRL